MKRLAGMVNLDRSEVVLWMKLRRADESIGSTVTLKEKPKFPRWEDEPGAKAHRPERPQVQQEITPHPLHARADQQRAQGGEATHQRRGAIPVENHDDGTKR